MANRAVSPAVPKTVRRRNDPRKDKTRERLLAIGLDAFVAKRYDDVSIAEIAAAANVSHGLIYHHFGSKRGFYLASLHTFQRQVRETLSPEASLGRRARIESIVLAYLRFAAAHGEGFRLVVTENSEDVHELLEADRMDVAMELVGDDAGGRPGPLLVLGVRGWIGFLESATLSWLAQSRPVDEAPLVKLIADCLEFVTGQHFQNSAPEPADG